MKKSPAHSRAFFIPDFAFKKRKKLIRSKAQSRSLCGTLILSVLKAARLSF
jgi:hypothetical protein